MKQIESRGTASPERVGPVTVARALPNSQTQAVGPVVFLDHVLEKTFKPREFPEPDGSFAHPHRGIATFTYLMKGDVIHFDSHGGYGHVGAGGVQWMSAGNGVVHDEVMPKPFRDNGGKFYAFQFWVNLPAKNKAEPPSYMPVQKDDLPMIALPENAGVLKVLLGEFDGQSSPVPAFSEQFIWHVRLNPGAKTTLPTVKGHEHAGYLPVAEAVVSSAEVAALEFFLFEEEGQDIVLENPTSEALDIMIFGGEPYLEPIVPNGPYIMNSVDEIRQAHLDFQQGKYGQIDYARTGM